VATDATGDYAFAIQVRDANGSTGSANYTQKVTARAVTVSDKVVDVAAGGSPADVYLNRGATGGPFTSAELVSVEPANAGSAKITQGQLAQAGPVTTPVGWYLEFTPNPAYSGPVTVGYRLVSSLGTSNTGTVTYRLSYSASTVADDMNSLVKDYVRARQSMISSAIQIPGLMERRKMSEATEPATVSVSPSGEGMSLKVSTSTIQMQAARDNADGAKPSLGQAYNIWFDGSFLMHNDESVNGDKWGTFGMISIGADYLVSDKALVGISFHYDHMTDPTDQDADLKGNGWLAGPYASLEVGKNIFWDTSLLYGGSSNTIDTALWDGQFDTRRWMFDTSVKGQWQIDQDTVFVPKLRAVYFSEKVEDYAVKNASGDIVNVPGFNEEQFRVSLGAEIARSFQLENNTKLTPKLGLTAGVSGIDGAGAFGSVTAGIAIQTADNWTIDTSLLFNLEGDGDRSIGAKASVSKRF
jgi:large repetitive protein